MVLVLKLKPPSPSSPSSPPVSPLSLPSPLLRRHSHSTRRPPLHSPRLTRSNLPMTTLHPSTTLTLSLINRLMLHLFIPTIFFPPNTSMRSSTSPKPRVCLVYISSFSTRSEDCADFGSARDGEEGCQELSRSFPAGAEVRGESVVGRDRRRGRRGKGFGYAGGDFAVPCSGGFVAEEVELGGVVCPGQGHVEFDTALLVGKMLASLWGV